MTPERPVNRAPPTMLTAAERRREQALAEPLPARTCAPVCDAVRAAARRDPQAPALDHGGRQWSYGSPSRRRERHRALPGAGRSHPWGSRGRSGIQGVRHGRGDARGARGGRSRLAARRRLPPAATRDDGLRGAGEAGRRGRRQRRAWGVRARRLGRDGAVVGARAGSSPARPRPTPSDPAYIFFTSGTTGRPKGIVGSHQGLSHFVQWEAQEFAIGPGDRVAQITTISFDAVLRDIFVPLTTGATICLPSPAGPDGHDGVA